MSQQPLNEEFIQLVDTTSKVYQEVTGELKKAIESVSYSYQHDIDFNAVKNEIEEAKCNIEAKGLSVEKTLLIISSESEDKNLIEIEVVSTKDKKSFKQRFEVGKIFDIPKDIEDVLSKNRRVKLEIS